MSTAFPAAAELARITSSDGYSYQLTPEDVLWLARSMQYEGPDPLSTAWTYAQRMALYRRWDSLAELVQAHSQPVNPIWRRDGAKCRPGGAFYGRDNCSEARLARRDEAASLPWERISSAIRSLVVAWATGQTDNPVPRATDFADAAVSRSFIEQHPGTQIVAQAGNSNWYLAEVGALDWPDAHVLIGGRAGSSWFARAGVAALWGGAAYVLWRLWQER